MLDREATDSKKEEIVSERKTEAFDKLYEEWAAEEGAFVLDEAMWNSIRFKDKITLSTGEEATETTQSVPETTEE